MSKKMKLDVEELREDVDALRYKVVELTDRNDKLMERIDSITKVIFGVVSELTEKSNSLIGKFDTLENALNDSGVIRLWHIVGSHDADVGKYIATAVKSDIPDRVNALAEHLGVTFEQTVPEQSRLVVAAKKETKE